jgi:Cu-processing system permease protein
MGYTGALYKDFFGSSTGILFTSGIMLLWITIPLFGALRIFSRKDI